MKEVVLPFEGSDTPTEVDDEEWGFRVDGVITRRITKLFPPDDGAWNEDCPEVKRQK